MRWRPWILVWVLSLTGCSVARVETPLPPSDSELYSSITPYYAELCAVSEIQKKPGAGIDVPSGGAGGHSIFYLNNVCRDDTAHYPTLKLCDAGTPSERRGVGLSVNSHFKNTQWIASEGRDFVFHGALTSDEALTPESYQKTQAQAKAMGIFDGVVFHNEFLKDRPEGITDNDYMYELSVGTDYATDFARNRYCARVPVSQQQMTKIVDFLNNLNQPYKTGQKDFKWDVFQDNCTHMIHNAFTAAGVWSEWAANQFILFAAFDFPVPANEFVNLMKRTNDMKLDDLDALYNDKAARDDLMQNNYLPTEAGNLAERMPVIQPNDIYNTDSMLIFYDDPFLGAYKSDFQRIFSEARYTDIHANLLYFSQLYKTLQENKKPLEIYLEERKDASPEERDNFAAFYNHFYHYIDQQKREIDGRLAKIGALQ